MGHNHAKVEKFCCIFANCMVKVIKNKVFRLLTLVSGLIFSIFMPLSAQHLPLLPEDAAVRRAVMPDGLTCYVADNPYVRGFADYMLVSKESGMALMSISDVPTTDEAVTDSTLIKIMREVEAHGVPAALAVIACGDLRADAVLSKLKYMSFMIPASGDVPGVGPSSKGATPVSLTTSLDEASGLATIRAEWRATRTPDAFSGTIQTAVYDKTVHELGSIVCSRVRKSLRDNGIPFADIDFRHLGSFHTMSDETFAFEITLKAADASVAERFLMTALASIDEYGASSSELLIAEKAYFKELEARKYNHDRTNAAYVQLCKRAYLVGAPLVSSAQRLDYLKSKDISLNVRERIFSGISSALLDLSFGDMASNMKTYLNASDTMSFPSVGPKVTLRHSRKEYLSGGVVWTFSNGFKVVYKRMAGVRTLYYMLALNRGYGDISNLERGEGAFVSEYFDYCNISGMRAQDFMKVLLLSGISMEAKVNISNVMVSGEAPESEVGLLMRSLLALANERACDEDALDYHIECERLRGIYGPCDLRSVTDSLMYPDYRYSPYKYDGTIPVDLSSKVEHLLKKSFSKTDDGVLVLVGDMDEADLRKSIMPYVGNFRTSEAASRKTAVHSRAVSGSMTYNVEGNHDAIMISMATPLPMTAENHIAAEMAAIVLHKIVSESVAPYSLDLHVDHSRRIYPEDRFCVTIMMDAPMGKDIPQEALNALRQSLSRINDIEPDVNHVNACKIYLKHKCSIQMQEPAYWLRAVAMRYLDGKDYTTGYASKVDAVSVEDIRKILRLLGEGSSIEYIINRK